MRIIPRSKETEKESEFIVYENMNIEMRRETVLGTVTYVQTSGDKTATLDKTPHLVPIKFNKTCFKRALPNFYSVPKFKKPIRKNEVFFP